VVAPGPSPTLVFKGKWIQVRRTGSRDLERTGIFTVETLDGHDRLGTIRWWGTWRKYSFFPDAGTLYEPKCLRDLANCVEQLTQDHLSQRRTA
jgi:hypothetical protein